MNRSAGTFAVVAGFTQPERPAVITSFGAAPHRVLAMRRFRANTRISNRSIRSRICSLRRISVALQPASQS
jgi:hypothetical protein